MVCDCDEDDAKITKIQTSDSLLFTVPDINGLIHWALINNNYARKPWMY
jgi:hypothetical protein